MNISWAADGTHFVHWPCRSAGWQGSFDPLTFSYSSISWDNLRSTVSLLQRIALSLRSYPMVLGLEALNEPWQFTPLDVLKAFYWDAYWAVRAAAPTWLFVVHDSFRLDEWQGFMKGCPAVALDTHVYQAWFDIRSQDSFLENACSWRQRVNAVQRATLPLLVGEWALATDNCAMVSEKRATQRTQRTRAHDTSAPLPDSPPPFPLSLACLRSGSTASTTTPPASPRSAAHRPTARSHTSRTSPALQRGLRPAHGAPATRRRALGSARRRSLGRMRRILCRGWRSITYLPSTRRPDGFISTLSMSSIHTGRGRRHGGAGGYH